VVAPWENLIGEQEDGATEANLAHDGKDFLTQPHKRNCCHRPHVSASSQLGDEGIRHSTYAATLGVVPAENDHGDRRIIDEEMAFESATMTSASAKMSVR
jgi:hypothetical protein